MDILIALLLLGVIIFIHELGHFLAARFFRMPVSEFAIGMGPELYSYYTGRTLYSVRIIPIGGFVNIDGMEVDSKVENGFNSKSPLARFTVLFAGVFMNFMLAFLVILGVTFASGKGVQNTNPVVGSIIKDVKASTVLKEKDVIKEIEGVKIVTWSDIGETVSKDSATKDILDIVVERDGKDLDLQVPLTKVSDERAPIMGIIPEYTFEKFGVVEGVKQASKIFVGVFEDTLGGVKMLLTGKVKAKDISGPVGIVKVVGDASRSQSSGILVWLLAILSVNVGIFNLLPFPALDGGRIIFVILELVGIKVDKKLEERVHTAGMLLLFGLIIFATANDLFNIFKI
ncbi:MAG: M50 family metallopeptidase [Cetobacterium sp.]|uniref:M50 family metallopeptidase n=1 Tax=unclassified Cetobacterium TaxID=2630983 RepID=UPI000648B50C|nr:MULTISPECIES: M50 family metallopeptidase [unclassified Cetobacterium]